MSFWWIIPATLLNSISLSIESGLLSARSRCLFLQLRVGLLPLHVVLEWIRENKIDFSGDSYLLYLHAPRSMMCTHVNYAGSSSSFQLILPAQWFESDFSKSPLISFLNFRLNFLSFLMICMYLISISVCFQIQVLSSCFDKRCPWRKCFYSIRPRWFIDWIIKHIQTKPNVFYVRLHFLF